MGAKQSSHGPPKPPPTLIANAAPPQLGSHRSRGKLYAYGRDDGHNFAGNDIWMGPDVGWGDCEARCDNDSNCQGFAWAPSHSRGQNWCELRSRGAPLNGRHRWDAAPRGAYYHKYLPHIRPSPVTYSGGDSNFRYDFQGTKYMGGFDGDAMQTYNDYTEGKCSSICAANGRCNAFTYDDGTKRCQLWDEQWDPSSRLIRYMGDNTHTVFKTGGRYDILTPQKVKVLADPAQIVDSGTQGTFAPRLAGAAAAVPARQKRKRGRYNPQ